jgi:hypothetical protein
MDGMGTKVLRVPPCYSQLPPLTDPPPPREKVV